jgi:hypothetical protein
MVEIPYHLDVVGHKTDRADNHGFSTRLSQFREMVADIGL